jgi:nucleoside-diphosphate-sugar epimerase
VRGRVLLTGGAGRIGALLVTGLQEDGWRVRAFTHRRPVDGADEWCHGTLLDPEVCRKALEGCDAVVHAAGVTHARRRGAYREANVGTTASLVTAAEQSSARRFLFVSSRTASPTGGWYSQSKLAAEQLVADSSLGWTIVRLPEIYGGGSGEGIDRLIASARSGGWVLVPGRGESELCPMHIDDAVHACVQALRPDPAVGGTYVLGGECLSLRTFVDRCIEVSGSDARVVSVPWALLRAAAFAGRLVGPVYPDQVARLRSPKPTPCTRADLAVEQRPLEAGLRAVMRLP